MVFFSNPGVIDVRSITTFGISAKTNANPIGYFGTGLKYAIAILLREGCELELWADGDQFVFGKKTIEQRGKKFDVLTMDEKELPFTTELGKNWELWQAFRELYCNALDEGGDVFRVSSEPFPSSTSGQTWFVVRGQAFEDLFDKKDEIVLRVPEHLRIPIDEDDTIQVFDRQSKFVYYRGIRVHELETPSLFTYNFLGEQQLTEDRTFAHSWVPIDSIHRRISRMKSLSHIRKALTAEKSFHEHDIGYSALEWGGGQPSTEFLTVLAEEFIQNNDRLNRSAADYQKKRMKATAAKYYEDAQMTAVEAKQMKRAMKALKKAFPNVDDYAIRVVKDLGEATMGLADRESRTIVLSKRCFELGTKFLASTILEEYAHLKTGHSDHTRELQTWLFDSICTLIENHITEEPL